VVRRARERKNARVAEGKWVVAVGVAVVWPLKIEAGEDVTVRVGKKYQGGGEETCQHGVTTVEREESPWGYQATRCC
jgi:hypothetical protein